MLPRLLSRDDIFISYSRADGAAYATGLADKLTAKGFSCFLDRLGTEPDHQLPESLKRRIRSCTMAVLVGTERAAASAFVEQEVAEFRKTKRIILPIDFGGAVGRARWYGLIPGLSAEAERPEAAEKGEPSEAVISRIEKSFRYTRRNQHMLRVFWLTAAMFVLVIGAGLLATYWSNQAARDAGLRAEAAKKDAEAQQLAAGQARRDAESQKEAARLAGLEAARQQALAGASALTARERLVDLSQEQGRLELLRGNGQQGFVYLSDAYRQRPHDEALRFMVAAARRSLVHSFRGAPEESRFREAARRGDIDLSHSFGLDLGYVAFSRDGTRIVTAGEDDITVRDARDGALLHRLRSNESERERANFATFINNDALILSRSDTTMKLWDAKTGRLARVLPELQGEVSTSGEITQLSPDETRLLLPGDEARVFDIAGGRLLYVLESHNDAAPMGGRNFASFSPDGKLIVTIYKSSTVSLWNAADGQLVATLIPAAKDIEVAAFSPDSKMVVTAGDDRVAKVWDTSSGQLLRTLEGHGGAIQSAAFDERGSYLATGSTDRTVKIWDAKKDFALVRTLEGHRSAVTQLAFNRRGRRLIAVCDAPEEPDARVWDVEQGLVLDRFPGQMTALVVSPGGDRALTTDPEDVVTIRDVNKDLLVDAPIDESDEAAQESISTALSPDGRYVAAAGSRGEINVWDARCRCLARTELAVPSVTLAASAFHPDGRQLAIPSSNGVRIIDVETGRARSVLKTGVVVSAAFSHDGRQIVVVPADGVAAEIWDVTTRRRMRRVAGTRSLQSAEFSSDDRVVVLTADTGGTIWNAKTGAPIGEFYGMRAELSSDGHFVATAVTTPLIGGGGLRSSAQITDARTGAHLPRFEHPASVSSASFSRDGKRLVTGAYDGIARVWDVGTRKTILSLAGHGRAVTSVAFSPDGGRIVTGDQQGALRIWDAARGQLLVSLPGHGNEIRNVTFNRDGSLLVSVGEASGHGVLRVWDVHIERDTPDAVADQIERWVPADVMRTLVRQTFR
jgi:WD40 repeat protein